MRAQHLDNAKKKKKKRKAYALRRSRGQESPPCRYQGGRSIAASGNVVCRRVKPAYLPFCACVSAWCVGEEGGLRWREENSARRIGGPSLQRVVHQQLLEDLRLARLPDLAGQEHLVHDAVHLVEVEDEVQLTNVVEVLVEHFHKIVDGLQVG